MSIEEITPESWLRRVEELTAERDHWKANHDNQVAIKRALLDRPDLAERAKLVQQLVKERDAAMQAMEIWKEAFDQLAKATKKILHEGFAEI